MTIARKQLIDLSHTPYYHCINRCVRRAWLCGDDPITGKNYDGRKQSIVNRMKFLTTVFGVELCAYAVMSNHYHVVLHVNAVLIDNLTEKEVAKRWVQVYKNAIGIRYVEGAKLDLKEQEAMNTYLPIWRERLKDISWYMRALNEGIARKANKEDDCKGHFWEGRFKSQALTDEAALLACMAYVDLNPIRANMAKTPEDSNHTSVQEHVISHQQANQVKLSKKLKKVLKENPHNTNCTPKHLRSFSCQNKNNENALPVERESYLELIDYTGKAIRAGSRGSIPENLSPILTRLQINPIHWVSTVSRFKHSFGKVVGSITQLDDWREKNNQVEQTAKKWIKGSKTSKLFYR